MIPRTALNASNLKNKILHRISVVCPCGASISDSQNHASTKTLVNTARKGIKSIRYCITNVFNSKA